MEKIKDLFQILKNIFWTYWTWKIMKQKYEIEKFLLLLPVHTNQLASTSGPSADLDFYIKLTSHSFTFLVLSSHIQWVGFTLLLCYCVNFNMNWVMSMGQPELTKLANDK